MRRRIALAALVSWLCLGVAHAQYPARPIKWVVPYPPGGITDSLTRLVVQRLETTLGQPVIVENRPGANSIVGAEGVARTAPDGYTFLTVIAAHAANATLYSGKLSFDPVKSFSPISLVGEAPLILTVNNDFPAKDVKDLIAYAKTHPGKISFGSSGVGAAAHLTTELLKQTTGVDMVHIAYKGTAPALTALLAGDIQVLVDTPLSMMPQVRAGKIRALGMFSEKRLPGSPEVPTIAEAGGPPLASSTWVMFLAPAGTPREIVQRISQETSRIVNGADLRAQLEQMGVLPVGSNPAETARYLDDEIRKWAAVIRAANVKLEQ